MSNKKQRKREMDEFLNPHILTLDQALALLGEDAADTGNKNQNAAQAVSAICNRVTCRFTGPSNFSRLTHGERMVWELSYMQGEVLNGGFHQYLTNSTGGTCEDVKGYLKDIDAVQTLDLFKRLSKIFPGGKVPRDRGKRCAIVEEWENQKSGDDVFEELSSAFYRQSENLDALIVAYVLKHRGDFVEPLDEVVTKLKRKDRIAKFCCGSAEPEWLARADEVVATLQEFAETDPTAQWKAETKATLKALAIAGKKSDAIRLYKALFMCSLTEAKAAVEQMMKSKGN